MYNDRVPERFGRNPVTGGARIIGRPKCVLPGTISSMFFIPARYRAIVGRSAAGTCWPSNCLYQTPPLPVTSIDLPTGSEWIGTGVGCAEIVTHKDAIIGNCYSGAAYRRRIYYCVKKSIIKRSPVCRDSCGYKIVSGKK